MKYLKNFKMYVALMAMSVAFVSCDKEGDANGDNSKPLVATQCSYSLTVAVADGAEDQNSVMSTVVSYPNYDGAMTTKNISFATEWNSTLSSPITTLPAEGVITIVRNVKEGVDLSAKEEYKVGIRYKLYVYSMDAEESVVKYDIKQEEFNEVVPAENMPLMYPETITLKFTVDAQGEVTIVEVQDKE